MPTVNFGQVQVTCELGANLRQVLMQAKLPLYHKVARPFHCRGLGTCGTCAVKIRGSVSWPTKIELWRLKLPPHTMEAGLRLACQCEVHGDVDVEKFGGVWGHKLHKRVIVRDPNFRVAAPRPAVNHSKLVLVDRVLFQPKRETRVTKPNGKLRKRAGGHRASMSDVRLNDPQKIRFRYRNRRALTKH
ncbi:MAG: 2Fe-2S iron-sulfur cluster-binding protein [Pirellulaceae bacterium]